MASTFEISFEKLEKKHVKNGGSTCLYCDSEEIEGGSLEFDFGAIFQKMRCNHCKRDWADSYKLVSVIE